MKTLTEIAAELLLQDDIWIFTHQNPDGDTLGSAFALQEGLRQLGKRVTVLCPNPFPKKYHRFTEPADPTIFSSYRIAVDIAAPELMGMFMMDAMILDCCIDHHKQNTMDAPLSYVDPEAAATCEIIYELLKEMGVIFSQRMVDALYTGIATDTGCFKFSNTTPKTHRIAAELMIMGADTEAINREIFDTKSRGYIQVQGRVLDTLEFHADGQIAVAVIPQALVRESGVKQDELDGISALPRQIEGVEIGVTMREREDGSYRVSVRTATKADASAICKVFGGGGHLRAGGATMTGALQSAKEQLVAACKAELAGR